MVWNRRLSVELRREAVSACNRLVAVWCVRVGLGWFVGAMISSDYYFSLGASFFEIVNSLGCLCLGVGSINHGNYVSLVDAVLQDDEIVLVLFSDEECELLVSA